MPAFMLLDVEVGRDRVGEEAGLDRRHRDAPDEAAAAVPDVEDHAALPALQQHRIQVPRPIELAPQARVHVGVDVARPQLLRDQLFDRPFGLVRPEVHHDGNAGDGAGFDGALDRRPLRTGIVRRLDPDDEALVLERHLGSRLGLHVGEVLLELAAAHAVADDVDERQHARPRSVDDPGLEVLEVPPAGAAGVGDRRHADAEAEPVGIDTVVPGVQPGSPVPV